MLDKLIIVFYINVGNLAPIDVEPYINKVSEKTTGKEEDESQMIKYYIPVRNEESKVVCLNPPTLISNENSYVDIMKKMQEIDSRLDKVTSKLYPLTREVITEKSV